MKRQVHEVLCTGACPLQERLLAQKCTFSSNLPAITSQKNCSKEDVLASTGTRLMTRGRLQARNRCVAPFQKVIILKDARKIARASMPLKRIYKSLHDGKARGPQTPCVNPLKDHTAGLANWKGCKRMSNDATKRRLHPACRLKPPKGPRVWGTLDAGLSARCSN